MKRVDTSEELAIFPQTVPKRNIAFMAGLAVVSAALLPLGWAEANWLMMGLCGFVGLLCGGMAWMAFRRQIRGNLVPSLKLSPQGLHLLVGTVGLVPWAEVNGLSSAQIGSNTALVINVNKDALGRLEQSPFVKASRKYDTALGVHALLFFQQQVEVPLHDLADMIHDYSIAHGGPAQQPGRTP